MIDTAEKSIVIGSKIKVVGGYRGFLMDLTGYTGVVRGIYECRGETRYITYIKAIDEYIEPTIKFLEPLTAEVLELNHVSERSVHQSGSVCA